MRETHRHFLTVKAVSRLTVATAALLIGLVAPASAQPNRVELPACDAHYLNGCMPSPPSRPVTTASHPNGGMYYPHASSALLVSLRETAPGVVGPGVELTSDH